MKYQSKGTAESAEARNAEIAESATSFNKNPFSAISAHSSAIRKISLEHISSPGVTGQRTV
ncbi:MAG TPA: hypothetical protein VHW45_10725 [Candidatus Sulfotelmatobacter sp.]|nr:hypothetical protein [Candidatus Sulfotelmatobacter sp.]